MTEPAPISMSVIKQNLELQIEASSRVLAIVDKLADAAGDKKNHDVSPAIAGELKQLIEISNNLRQNANAVAVAVVKNLESA